MGPEWRWDKIKDTIWQCFCNERMLCVSSPILIWNLQDCIQQRPWCRVHDNESLLAKKIVFSADKKLFSAKNFKKLFNVYTNWTLVDPYFGINWSDNSHRVINESFGVEECWSYIRGPFITVGDILTVLTDSKISHKNLLMGSGRKAGNNVVVIKGTLATQILLC